MKNIKKFLFTILLCMPLMFVSAKEPDFVTTQLEDGNEIIEQVNDADYKAGETVITEGNFFGSVFYAGNTVTSNSVSKGIGFLAGNSVTINGVKDYVISAGNNVVIDGEVINDAILAGNTVRISGNVGRDVIIAAANVVISGEIDRNVKIYASEVTIKGNIKGNVDVSAEIINIDDDAIINGYVNYNSDSTMNKSEKAMVGELKTYTIDTKVDFSVTLKETIYGLINSYINLLIVALVMTYLLPNIFTTLKDRYSNLKVEDYFKLFGKGLLFLIGIPVLAIVLLLSSVAISLSFILIALYFILSYITIILTGYVVGNIIWTKLFKKEENKYIALLIGIAVIKIVELVPIIGALVSVASLFIGLGIVVGNVLGKKNKEIIK